MSHIVIHKGKGPVALGLMHEGYVPLYVPWINAHTSVEGTLQRPPYSLASGEKWVRELDDKKGKDEVFAILYRPTQGKHAVPEEYEYIGHTGIHGVTWPDGFATTGSIIGNPAHQAHGYGTEAKLLLLYHAFRVLGLRKMVSSVKSFNVQSAGHLLKCGYRYVGRHRKHHWHKGAHVDELIFEVFREDWQPIWDAYQETGALPPLTVTQRDLIKLTD